MIQFIYFPNRKRICLFNLYIDSLVAMTNLPSLGKNFSTSLLKSLKHQNLAKFHMAIFFAPPITFQKSTIGTRVHVSIDDSGGKMYLINSCD